MIKKVKYNENGSIEIDNTELLGKRADVIITPKESLGGSSHALAGRTAPNIEIADERSGGLMKEGGEEEKQLKVDLKRTGWKESRKATDVKHACPVCGTRYWGRPNKNYCGIPCKEIAKKRRQRKRKRDIRDFKPHAGTAGEIYYMIPVKGRDAISFIPANFADTRIKAKGYIEERYSTEDAETILEQIKEVLKK